MSRGNVLCKLPLIVGAALALSALAASPATAQTSVQHGIGFTKGCVSPVAVGAQYSCSFTVRNVVDEAEDTLTFQSIVDVVHASGGDVNSGNFMSQAQLDDGGTSATCSGGSISGSGTPGDPWVGATSCTLPFGSRINVHSFAFYTVKAEDLNLPNSTLTDTASLDWRDVCDDPADTGNSNCNANPPNAAAASQAHVVPGEATTTTTTIGTEGSTVSTAPAVTTQGSPGTSPGSTVTATAELPRTGGSTALPLLLGAVLVALGLSLRGVGRARKHAGR
jgi:hypothetical protein